MVLCRINLTSHLDRAPVPLIVETTWPVPGPGPRGAHQCSELCSPPTHVSWCQVFKQCRRYHCALTSPQAFCVNFDLLNMEEDNIVNSLSDKSRSLRKTSVKKRLETELLKKTKKVAENIIVHISMKFQYNFEKIFFWYIKNSKRWRTYLKKNR